MSPDLVLAVLFAALLHALWNSFVKVGSDRAVAVVAIIATGGLLSLPVAVALPPPPPLGLLCLVASVTTHLIYYYFLINAYRFGDLSRVYPLARGLAPPLVAIGAAAVAGEWLTGREIAGVALVSLGIGSLVFGGYGAADRRGLWFAAATGVMIAIYTIIDGIGGRSAPQALRYIAWLNVVEAIVFVAVVRWRRGPALWPALRGTLPGGAVAGVLATLSYAIVIYAMSRGAMAHVSALRESSVVIAALIGTLWLGEPGAVARIGAATIVAAGVLVMHWR